jgi:GYF domain 2
MASLWIIQTESMDERRLTGPLTFEQMAQRLAEGTLNESDLVRPETGDEWQTIDTVIGLHRAVQKLQCVKNEGHGDKALADGIVDPSVVPEPKIETGKIRETDADRQTVPTTRIRTASIAQLLFVFAVLAGLGWYGWSLWFETQRFPRPAHLRDQSQPLSLPWIGPVSHFEMTVTIVDAIAVAVFAMWWFRSKRRKTHDRDITQ